ncbi:MAG: LysM peptidoglycan-binding domain-containing protein [Campylobacterales bacterium]
MRLDTMNKLFFIFLALVLNLSAALYEPAEDRRDRSVLVSLDVDESFLQDAEFQTLKNNYAVYRQQMFLRILSDAYIYQPLIKQMIADAGLPPALVYMAMAESSFKPRAYSTARATGIWQFMPATAKRYGLRVDMYVDERRDPIKSTQAAIRYLNDLHAEFGKWSLAIMAYNCGEGRVRSAIRQAGSDDIADLLKVRKGTKRQYLPQETRGYLRKVLAMASLAESETLMLSASSEHLLNRGSSYPMVTVQVAAGATLQEIAKAAGESVESLRLLNPSLRYEFVPPYGESFDLNIPYEKAALFKQNYVPKENANRFMVYQVQKGDSLGGIGNRFGVSYAMIKDFNNLKSNLIRPGQHLVIPVIKPQRANDYIVQRGDSLQSIARKFNTSVERLKDANNLQHNTIYAGDKLIIRR